jgi:diguanylate cyclase (GGDEF)-like protein
MKKLIAAFAVAFGCISPAWAVMPATLTTLHAVHALSHAEAGKEPPVAFEATVTYRREQETTLFVEDAGVGIYVSANADMKLAPGDRVLVRGKASDSFRPIVVADSVTLLHHGPLPKPMPATFDELIHAQRDCVFVTIRARVLSIDLVRGDDHMVLLVDGGLVKAYIDGRDGSAPSGLLDAEVEVTGVASATFDGKMQQTGVGFSVPSGADIKIIKRASATPWALPTTRMDEIISNYRVKNLSQRVRVHGTITYYQPSSVIVLQSGSQSLWIMTLVENPLRVGDQADVSGFPEVQDGFLSLSEGEIQEIPVYDPIVPKQVTLTELASSKHIFDLVSIEAQVVMEVPENSQDEYVLASGGKVFSAIYRYPYVAGMEPLPMKRVLLGSTVRVSGISTPLDKSNTDQYRGDVPFNILMRTPDDIAVVARPSLLNVRNLILLVGLLLAVVVVVGARGWIMERKGRRQTAALALIEQRRSRILEDINGSRPLAEMIEEITELVSLRLLGAPCWCQIADGAQLGNYPQKLTSLRIVQNKIPARTGRALGTLFVAFDPLAKTSAKESEALSMAVALTALAIETRHLYSDLLHRSEFDLLTDVHNRFSLARYLDRQIDEARRNAGVFGLIYIDLDKFKRVNDLYGHQVGDLYLQEVALRMKRQLRNVDMLARLGGDEFAVLLPLVHNRAKVEEIAQRLERCFEEPFTIEGQALHGSASVGVALYPEDGATRDNLLNAADVAMYVTKNTKREIGVDIAEQRSF